MLEEEPIIRSEPHSRMEIQTQVVNDPWHRLIFVGSQIGSHWANKTQQENFCFWEKCSCRYWWEGLGTGEQAGPFPTFLFVTKGHTDGHSHQANTWGAWETHSDLWAHPPVNKPSQKLETALILFQNPSESQAPIDWNRYLINPFSQHWTNQGKHLSYSVSCLISFVNKFIYHQTMESIINMTTLLSHHQKAACSSFRKYRDLFSQNKEHFFKEDISKKKKIKQLKRRWVSFLFLSFPLPHTTQRYKRYI